jgi:hypothetical protein
MDTGSALLTPAERKTWRDVLDHYEAHRLPDGWLRFICVRCRLAFSYAGRARSTAGPLHLKAHLARHGVTFTETAPAKRAKKPGARQRDFAGNLIDAPTTDKYGGQSGL